MSRAWAWYAHNLLTAGMLSGLSESLMLRGMSHASMIGRAATVPWGMATTGRWYMYAVVGAEVTLLVAGLRQVLPARLRHWAAFGGVLLFALLDLYTVHGVAIPYYSGMIAHKANGALATLRLVVGARNSHSATGFTAY